MKILIGRKEQGMNNKWRTAIPSCYNAAFEGTNLYLVPVDRDLAVVPSRSIEELEAKVLSITNKSLTDVAPLMEELHLDNQRRFSIPSRYRNNFGNGRPPKTVIFEGKIMYLLLRAKNETNTP